MKLHESLFLGLIVYITNPMNSMKTSATLSASWKTAQLLRFPRTSFRKLGCSGAASNDGAACVPRDRTCSMHCLCWSACSRCRRLLSMKPLVLCCKNWPNSSIQKMRALALYCSSKVSCCKKSCEDTKWEFLALLNSIPQSTMLQELTDLQSMKGESSANTLLRAVQKDESCYTKLQ